MLTHAQKMDCLMCAIVFLILATVIAWMKVFWDVNKDEKGVER